MNGKLSAALAAALVVAAILLELSGYRAEAAGKLQGAVQVLGLLVVVAGAGGLVAVALAPGERWRADALRWGIVALAGGLAWSTTWGLALALAAGLFALAWSGPDVERY